MSERDKDRRKKRTSLNQYLMYLQEMEHDDIFRTGTIPKDVEFDYITKKWEKLSEKLNTCDNGPSMTPDEWKKRLNDWKNSTRCKFRRSQNGEKGIAITALEKKALALFGTAPYSSTNIKGEVKQNTSSSEAEHNAEVESMLQEVEFSTEEIDPENHIIIRKRNISDDGHSVHLTTAPKSIKLERTKPINKKTIIFDFDASDENLDEDNTDNIIIEDPQPQKPENITMNSPKKVSMTQTLHHAVADSTSSMHASIAYQLKRIADVKEEKLMFEIAKYKFNNPGFKYQYTGTNGTAEEPQEEVMVNVYSEEYH